MTDEKDAQVCQKLLCTPICQQISFFEGRKKEDDKTRERQWNDRDREKRQHDNGNVKVRK